MKSTTASTSKNTTAFPLSLNHLTDRLTRRCHPSVTSSTKASTQVRTAV
jgi:hypothetical protein